MEMIIGEADMELTEIHKTIIPDILPWTISPPPPNKLSINSTKIKLTHLRGIGKS